MTPRPPESLGSSFDDEPTDDPRGPSTVSTVWAHRRFIALGTAALAAIYAIILVAASALLRETTTASLDFTITFPSARTGKYPSGAPFSPEDIVAAPVLEQVFNDNKLNRYGDYWRFRNAFTVVSANPDLDLLNYEFKARFSEPRLTPVDRARTEDEFRRRRIPLSTEPSYSLRFRRDSRFRTMPDAQVQKALLDILVAWANQAENRKGAITYDIAVFSRAILQQEAIQAEEYLVGADIIRIQIARLITNIDQIQRIPGAQLIRVGENRIALPEVRANLEDTQRFVVQPLIGLIQYAAVARDPQYLLDYFKNRLTQIDIDRSAAQERASAFRKSLRDYSAGRTGGGSEAGNPQTRGEGSANAFAPDQAARAMAGGSFLERLLELYTRGDDLDYRQRMTDRIAEQSLGAAALDREQAYYQELAAALRRASPLIEERRALFGPVVERQMADAVARVGQAIDAMNAVFDSLSASNLNAPTLLYRIVGPARIDSLPVVAWRYQWAGLLAILLGGPIVLALSILVWSSMRAREEDDGAADAPDDETAGGGR